MDFNQFRAAIDTQFQRMQDHTLFKVDVSKHDLWDTYLGSFPEGSNPIFMERTHHDCQCCKQFIRTVGNVVAIINGKPQSIWSCGIEDDVYRPVAEAMAALVEGAEILHPFFHYEKHAGTRQSHSNHRGEILTWDHYHVLLPDALIMRKDAIATRISKLRSSKDVFQRSLEEIETEAIDTVLELISQKSLYRGDEHKPLLETFRETQQKYLRLATDMEKLSFVWDAAFKRGEAVLRIRNSAIGTLLVDLSEGKSLDAAVGAFEAMVAPANYKRPTALVTKTMIKNAQEKVAELGFLDALERRHAVPEDITVNNVLFANRNARKAMSGDVFTEMMEEETINPRSLSRVEEVDIDTFLNDVLPKSDSVELLVENRHTGNFMSLIAPKHAEAPNMLKWENNFSWAYNGDLADSMKQHVKAEGGEVEGVMRFSIMWNDEDTFNQSDYDAHCVEPSGNRIFYQNKRNHQTTGQLDVDIIHPVRNKPAVENITWINDRKMQRGKYRFSVHGFSCRPDNSGFKAEFECNDEIYSFEYPKAVRQGEHVQVISGEWDGTQFTPEEQLPSTVSSRNIWEVPTMQFRPVSMVMLSPNHWDDHQTGNRHFFFILEGCLQPGNVRGFYNEFLTDELREHRKVFEVLGSKMKAEESDQQLSGLGFSSTQRNDVYCRVKGSFTRTIKLTF